MEVVDLSVVLSLYNVQVLRLRNGIRKFYLISKIHLEHCNCSYSKAKIYWLYIKEIFLDDSITPVPRKVAVPIRTNNFRFDSVNQ